MRLSIVLPAILSALFLSTQQVQAQFLGGLFCRCQAGTRCATILGCIPCPAGSSSPGSSTSCTSCPANTFSSRGGLCDPCPAGTESGAGSTSCQACPAGTSSVAGGGCRRCPSGSTSSAGASSCTRCSAGTFASAGSSTCQPCPAGQFQDESGQEGCKVCSRGSFQSQTGRTSCETCPCGTFSDRDGSTACTSCDATTPISDPGSQSLSACFPLSLGSTSDANGCLATCPSGTFLDKQPAGTRTCTTCPEGQVAQSGSISCQPCRIGTAPDATRATCTPTSTNQLRRRSKIPLCPPGHAACPVGRRKNLECVDISRHLNSCGGCPGSGEGVDCTTFDSRASATCVNGQCQYSCPRGYTMTPQGCTRQKRRP